MMAPDKVKITSLGTSDSGTPQPINYLITQLTFRLSSQPHKQSRRLSRMALKQYALLFLNTTNVTIGCMYDEATRVCLPQNKHIFLFSPIHIRNPMD